MMELYPAFGALDDSLLSLHSEALMTPLRQRMTEDMQIRNLSPSTIECYTYHVGCFAKYFNRSPEHLGPEQIRQYQVHLVCEKKVSWSTFNQTVCGLRFLYRHTLPRPWAVDMVPFGKRPKVLPAVLSCEEVQRLLVCVKSIKQRTVFITMYAAGLRISEALHLRVKDIDSERMQLLVAHGKGNKQRLSPISPKVTRGIAAILDRSASRIVSLSRQDERSALEQRGHPEGLQAGSPTSGSPETSDSPHSSPQLRDGTLGSGRGSLDDWTIARSPKFQFDFDLPPRPPSALDLYAQSTRVASRPAVPAVGATADPDTESAKDHHDGPRVIDILRRHVADYVRRCSPPLQVRSALAKLSLCRTTALGGQAYQCKQCGAEHVACHSCGDRHCPLCRGASRANWQQRMADSLLSTAYFQGVFTIPKHLSSLTLGNRRAMYKLLFRAAGQAFCEMLVQERGIQAAPLLVLHTWDQRLEAHAHIHLLHPAGGPSLCGTRWISCQRIQNGKHRGKLFLVDVRKLSDRFHDKFLKGLERLRRRGELKLDGKWSRLLDDKQWKCFLKPLRTQQWAVYLEPPPSTNASAENLLKYLARYVTGGPISNRRLISHENGQVTFWARDKSKTGNQVPVHLPVVEFVRRWSLHIVPSGFHRVRYYGGLHPSKRKDYLSRCRVLLQQLADEDNCSAISVESNEEQPSEVTSRRQQLRQGICPNCGGELRVTWSTTNRRSWSEVLSSPLAPNWYQSNGP